MTSFNTNQEHVLDHKDFFIRITVLKRPKADNPYETRSMPIQTRVPILDRILFVIVMQDKENYRYDGSTDADVTKINKRKHER